MFVYDVFINIHEHQNPRGKGIDWNKPNVYAWAESTQGWDKATTDKNILNRYDITQINGSEFDPLSIMLYFFPAKLTNNDKGTAENLRISPTDAKWLAKEYPNGSMSPSDFYQNVYGVDIDSVSYNWNGESKSKKWILMVVIAVVSIGILIALFFGLRKHKNKNKNHRRR